MDFGPDSITYSNLGFIAQHKKVFSPEEVAFPDDKCNTVAVAPRYGLVFCSNDSIIKVFQTKDLSGDDEPPVLATIDTGCPITHLSASCDGLTLLAIVLVEDKPRALFYEIRYLVPGCENLSPFAATGLKGARVQAVAWNPMDPNSVAVAITPDELCVISLKEDKVETKSRLIKARALSWSPKGKQLTAGLADGSLALFKPDLQLVRTVKNPPMEEASAVQSITWFTNTEFFIGYKVESEEGGQVMMYVNAPKAQEPKYVLYEFICSENAGSRPAAFYQAFFPEWSILCLASSRAFQLGVLGKAQGGSEGWCEFELEEGRNADMHGINITQTTYPMGLAVDFTSQKTFTNKVNEKESGPCPVLYVMSTGGELNMFHLVNSVQGVDPLVVPPETLPKIGHRTAEQYGGSAVVPLSIPKPAPAAPPPSAPKATFMSPSPGMSILGGNLETPKPVSSSSDGSSTSFGSSFFGGAAQPKPLLPKFTTQAPLTASISGGMTLGKSSPIQFGGAATTTTAVAPVPFTQQTLDEKDQQKLKASLVFDGKLGGGGSAISTPAISTPAKSQTPSPIPSSPLPRAVESQKGSKSPSPLTTAGLAPAPSKEKDSGDKALLSVISSVVAQFQLEIQAHSDKETDFQIGSSDEMANIRRSLVEESSWIEQMSSTTSELFGEITQLHYEVLQGFKLREEADAQIAKSKNPRHFSSMQSRQLDPHSRRTLDNIRVKYQYLQSQLEEVNTKLHLDWINYTNAMKSRKKRDLPVSETVYNALMKCHTLRTRQERELELLCDRLKVLEVDSLSRGLRVNRPHNNDDVIASLEKSLSEVKVTPLAYVSPVKMLSQGKQEKLQKILSQRSTIPVRKCSSSPKSPLMNLLNSSDTSHHQNKLQDNSISFPVHTSFSLNTEASFGPQTFSTPQRSNKVSLGAANALSAADGKSNNFLSGTQKKADPIENVDGSAAANGLSLTGKSVNSATLASKEIVTGLDSLGVVKPVYEDITPPQTPDNKTEVEVKSASPLLALSSLVSKVPTTTAVETVAAVTPATDTKLSFGEGTNFCSLGTSSGPISFSFKPPQSLAATEISTPKPSISLTTTEISSALPTKAENSKLLPQFTTANFSSGQLLGSVSVASSQGAGTGASLTGGSLGGAPAASLASSMFSFKGATPSNSTGGGLFTLKLPSASSSFSPGITSTSGVASVKSSFTAVSSTGSTSIFSGLTSGQLSIGTISTPSPVVTTTTAMPPSTQNVTATTVSESKLLQSDPVTSTLKVSDVSEEASAASLAEDSTSEVTNTGAEETSEMAGSSSKDSMVISKLISSSVATSSVGLFSSVKSPEEVDKPASESSGSNLFSSVFSPSGSATMGTMFQGAGTSGGMFGVKSPSSGSMFGITTASSSMFKSPETTSSGGIFGGSTSATTGSLFGPPKTTESGGGGGIFGTAKATESGGGIFGTAKTTESGSIFGTAKTTESGGIFATAKTTESGGLFGTALPSSSSGSIFGGAALSTGNSLVSKPATPVKSTAAEILPSSTTATTSASGSVSTVSSPSSGSNLFGGISTPASASGSSVFGGVLSATTTTTGTMFSTSGALSVSTMSASPGFGSSGTITTTSPFGTSGTTTVSSPFGTPGTTTATSPFGTSGTTSASSAFGSSGTSSSGTTFGQSSAFGSLSTSSSAFGTLSTTTTFSGFSSAAGGGLTLSAASTTTSSGGGASLFGQAQQKSDSIFGQTSQTSTPSIFGGQTASTGSVFGGATQSQGTTSVFGSSASQSGSIFGGTSTQPSGTSIFGQSATSSTVTSGNGIGFGQSAPAVASPFASASTTSPQEASSPFSSSGFGIGTSSGGGGFFSGLGSKPNEENAGKNIFGSTSFSAAKPQLSLFGGSSQGNTSSFGAVATSTSSFGAGQTGTSSTFGNPGFGGPANTGATSGEASQSAFGMTASPKASGFGNNAAFGGSPVFGGAAAFGSPPKFGSSPAFGSPPAFGSMGGSSGGFSGFASAGTSTFGSVASSTSSSGGFGGFSGQSSGATFGSVAQQSPGQQQQQQQQQSTFGSSGGSLFSGGSSFSTWR